MNKLIQELRRSLDLSQRVFGQLVGVDAVTVSRWESNATTPRGLSDQVVRSLSKIVGAGRGKELLAGLQAEDIALGSGTAFHRIFSMAFGFPAKSSVASKR